MNTLRILRQAVTEQLAQAAGSDPERLNAYRDGPAPSEATADASFLNTLIAPIGDTPELECDPATSQSRAAGDAANAIRIHQHLPNLTRVQAADRRLWITLVHGPFWEYARKRWVFDETEKGARTNVLRHWFFADAAGKAALRTHAISRLWWAGHLTYAPWKVDGSLSFLEKSDPYHYTRVLLSQQQIYFDIVERDFGSDTRIRVCLLDALSAQLPAVSRKDELSGRSSKKLNLLLRSTDIAALDTMALHKRCVKLVAGVAEQLSRSRS